MAKEPSVPKEIIKELGLKAPKPLNEHAFTVKPHFYEKDGILKFVRIYIPTGIVSELNLTKENSLELTIDTDKNINGKIVIMTVKK